MTVNASLLPGCGGRAVHRDRQLRRRHKIATFKTALKVEIDNTSTYEVQAIEANSTAIDAQLTLTKGAGPWGAGGAGSGPFIANHRGR